MKKVAFHTLGCKLNFAETSTLASQLTDKGFERVKFNETADVYVINTCSVTEYADKKCRNAIRKAIRQSPDAYVVAVGCYAQLQPETLAQIEGVDLVLGANEKFELTKYLDKFSKEKTAKIHSCEIGKVESFSAAFSAGDRTRAFLKVQDGCDYKCSYCTIPLARGRSRNAPIDKLLRQANEIAEKGIKEIVLTGVNIGDFGKTTGDSFFDLIQQLDKVKGIERYRISSIEPNLLTHEILNFVTTSEKFLPHFHIPLQAGCNEILTRMRRRYKREVFADRIHRIKQIMPDAFIGADVIVGFPGETDDLFDQTYNFIESLPVSFIHVFSYSVRPDTPASEMKDKVSHQKIVERSERLHKLSEKKHRVFYESQFGKTYKVLFENRTNDNKMHGFSENYIKVEVSFDETLLNTIRKVKIGETTDNESVIGELIN